MSKLKVTEDANEDNAVIELATLNIVVSSNKRTFDQVTRGDEQEATPVSQKRLKLPKEDSFRSSNNE